MVSKLETDENGQYLGIVFVYFMLNRPGIAVSSYDSAVRVAPPVTLRGWIGQEISRNEGVTKAKHGDG